MSAKHRADLINKLYKYVKKEYSNVTPPSNRSVIEHMLYACCLEDSTFESADEAFAKLQENYFDWNEVRVTTAAELAELVKCLAEPTAAAIRLKKALHGIFETYYQFDIDFLKKENLSKAIKQFEKMKGVTPFVISYVAQNGLGGHSIPLDRSAMLLLYTIGAVSEAEAAKGRVPGLERTIPKAKGMEFSNLMHQFAVTFSGAPFSTKTRDKILKIAKDAKERFPKRGSKKKKVEEPKPEPVKVEAEPKPAKPVKKAAAKGKAKPAPKKAAKKVTKAAKKPAKKAAKKATKKTKVTAKAKKTAKTTKAKKKSTRSVANKKLARKKPR